MSIDSLRNAVSDHLGEKKDFSDTKSDFLTERERLAPLEDLAPVLDAKVQSSVGGIWDSFDLTQEELDEQEARLEEERRKLFADICGEQDKTAEARTTAEDASKKRFGNGADGIVREADAIIQEQNELLDMLGEGDGAAGAEGGYAPNSKVTIDNISYRTDDTGQIHMQRGEDGQYRVLPNMTYTVNGYTYNTDEQGRITNASGVLRIREAGRQSLNAKVADMQDGDQRGHIIADLFGGSNANDNLTAQLASLNQGAYKTLEGHLADLCKEHEVRCRVSIFYDDDTARPDMYSVSYTVDGGEEITVDFANYE